MYAWHNRFARYVCLTLPFATVLFSINKSTINRLLLGVLIIAGVLAIILSTSRGGMFAVVLITMVWILYLCKKSLLNFRKIFLISIIGLVTMFLVGLFISPTLQKRIGALSKDMKTFNERLDVWNEALESAKERPILGWGYGSGIFHRRELHVKTTTVSPPKAGPENMFIHVLFHQGIVGLGVYISLLVAGLFVFFKSALRTENSLRACVLVTVCGIILGNYVGHSLVANVIFRGLAIQLAIGIAALHSYSHENSHT